MPHLFLTSALLYQNQNTDTSKVIGSLNDLTKKKTLNLFLMFVSGNPATLDWRLEPAEGSHSDPNFQYGVTLPRIITLTKQ